MERRCFGFLGGILLFLSLLSVSGTTLAQEVICRDQVPVPDGYVITEQVPNSACVTGYGVRIQLPVDNLLVCVYSPIPSPFVVIGGTDGTDTTTCKGVGRLLIHTASDNMMVCSNSPIPAGYGITYYTSERQTCLIGRVLIRTLEDGMLVCSLMTAIPNPYVVTWVGSGLNCGNAHQTYRINVIQDGISVCAQSTVHPDYVITKIVQGSYCGSSKTYTVNQVLDGIHVCENSPIPAGYVVTWKGTYATCGSSYQSYRLNLVQDNIEVCSASPIPAGYVITTVYDNSPYCMQSQRYRLGTPYEGVIVCANSPIPAGWKKDGAISVNYCSVFQGYRLTRI
ncbi:hypothetical protein ACWKWK_10710 [Pseudoxanthomonas beigongshangi]